LRPEYLAICFILSISPISEVRGAIPYVLLAFSDGYSRVVGLIVSIIGNLIVPLIAYPLLDLLNYIIQSRRTPRVVKHFYNWVISLGKRKSLSLRRGSYIALALFVGVPLPMTGAWTGTLVAYILGLEREKSILAIEAGVLIASIIVLVAAYTGIELLMRLFLA